jgi:hypothetical protein
MLSSRGVKGASDGTYRIRKGKRSWSRRAESTRISLRFRDERGLGRRRGRVRRVSQRVSCEAKEGAESGVWREKSSY